MEQLILAFIIGMVVGGFIAKLADRLLAAKATLRIDHSDPGKDVYRLDLDRIVDLDERTHLLLKIDHNADLSQR